MKFDRYQLLHFHAFLIALLESRFKHNQRRIAFKCRNILNYLKTMTQQTRQLLCVIINNYAERFHIEPLNEVITLSLRHLHHFLWL